MLPPPPPPRGTRRLTARPANPQGLGQPRGGGPLPPPPTTPKTVAHPWGSHIGWRRPRAHCTGSRSPLVVDFFGAGVPHGLRLPAASWHAVGWQHASGVVGLPVRSFWYPKCPGDTTRGCFLRRKEW